MSSEDDFPSELVRIEASSEFENDDEALETLVQLKKLSFDEILPNRDTQLDTEEGESILIRFSHDDKLNNLTLRTGPESNVRVSLSLANDDIDEASKILSKIFEEMAELSVDTVVLFTNYEFPFNSLELPINDETDIQVTGIKIRHHAGDYIIQQDEDGTSVNVAWEDFDDDDETVISDIGTKQLNETEEFIDSLQ